LLAILLVVLGGVALVLGAHWLVLGASKLAVGVGISPLVIGLTVVAFGTSAPELAVSVASAATDAPEIAIGNVVGSNIFNILLILGCSAVITPLIIASRLVRLDIPLMVLASLVTWWFCADGDIGRWEGAGFFGALIVYTVWLVRSGDTAEEEISINENDSQNIPPWRQSKVFQIGLIIVGLASLVAGSQMMVSGAVSIAEYLGISAAVIGLTIVAGGTSLPELATSVIAARAGQRDIAVGNVIGSNLFNLLGVLGLSAIVSHDGLPVAATFLRLDIPVMVLVSVILLPMAIRGRRIGRAAGGFLLVGYVVYVIWMVRAATV
jgi:cation:H+ antiporter